MATALRSAKDVLDYRRVLSDEADRDPAVVREVMGDQRLLAEAKRLHAAVYLARGFIQPPDIQAGVLTMDADPHQLHSDYFVAVSRGRVAAVARQIH